MSGRVLLVLLAALAIPLYLLVGAETWQQRGDIRRAAEAGYVIPSRFSEALALEHKGLLSDYYLLKTITFFGERVMHDQPLSEDDWRFIIGSLDAVTDLDPYFLDPYLLAEGLLTWESGKYEEANRLLKKGLKYREKDWRLPFYLGFNYFHFLNDHEKGADYLLEAAALPGSPSFLPDLASRIGYYGGKTKTAIMFLKGLIAQTDEKGIRARLEKRLLALERAAYLEETIERFEKEKGRAPHDLEELLASGYLESLPGDPYGGKWVITDFGRVFSTSRFVDVKAGEGRDKKRSKDSD